MPSHFITRFLAAFAALATLATAQPVAPVPPPAQPVDPTDPAQEPAVQAVARTMPAVVNINTEWVIKRTVRDPYDEFFYDFFGRMRPPRQIRQKVQSLGSGFLIDGEGYIVTNEHVVERAAEMRIAVTTDDGKTYQARYITGSRDVDLALIKIEGDGKQFPFIPLDDLSPSLLGQTVLVLGNPVGYSSSVARGILSAKNRTVELNGSEYRGLLQTDAAINPGNSGGPVVDLRGRLVGVSSVKMAFTPQGVPTQGIGFAIPAEVVRDKVAEFRRIAARQALAAKAEPAAVVSARARARLGLTLQDLTPDIAERLGLGEESGVLIADVAADSPAERAGIERGMIIHEVGRYEVTSVKQIEELLEPIGKGSLVDVTVSTTGRIRGRPVRRLRQMTLTAQ